MKRALNIGLMTLTCTLLFWACGGGASPEEVGKQFLENLKSGKDDARAKAVEMCYDKMSKDLVESTKGAFMAMEIEVGSYTETNKDKAGYLTYKLRDEEYKLHLKKDEEKGWQVRFRFSRPDQVAKAFLEAMKVQDYEAAKKLATETASASIEMMAGMSDASKKGDANEIQIDDVSVDGENANVKYTDSGTAKELKLKKVDGMWKAEWEKEGPNLDGGDMGDMGDLGEDLSKALEEAMGDLEDEIDSESTEDDE